MNELGLGKLITTSAARDAIHIAVVPVTANEMLSPGEPIGLVAGSKDLVESADDPIGVVDPYLKNRVLMGERFWMFLLPGSIMSLRHDWTHPAFDPMDDQTAKPATESPIAPVDASRAWIQELANQCDQTYNRLMGAAERWVEYEDYTHDNSERYKRVEWGKWGEFWKHYEIVTGTKIAEKNRKDTFFTCSC